ncbi:response regulator [Methylophaga sulfidovorans]|uniref:Two-component system, OmpR family, KDP operon response regulator KdpE n=1 Tax=Methylophaga sulfidovorans TaxID=45496 RepID=A0A1I3Z0Y5_9GAMM|nr:response regulator transcription factor [Methylophaga sulfidovorans]SFK37718.1 two-component system, OmpR family, KDP operon response regulator KdpE [Methylophaga sulfidovorans]
MNIAAKTILIIEDEAQIRQFLRISLEAQSYTVVIATNAAEGLELAGKQPVDLIILDLGLPDRDGQQVIQELRKRSQIPIIVLSVRASEDEKVRALDAGANDYVTKPFGISELMARVRALIRINDNQPSTQAKIQFDNLTIDTQSHEVWLDNQAIHLSRKEFELLYQLTVTPGRILTHQQLLKIIWGEHFVSETHYLRILVGHLRQKLNDDPMQPRFIITVQGIGYRFKY